MKSWLKMEAVAGRTPQAGVDTADAPAEPSATVTEGVLFLEAIGSVDFRFGRRAMSSNMARFAAAPTAILPSEILSALSRL